MVGAVPSTVTVAGVRVRIAFPDSPSAEAMEAVVKAMEDPVTDASDVNANVAIVEVVVTDGFDNGTAKAIEAVPFVLLIEAPANSSEKIEEAVILSSRNLVWSNVTRSSTALTAFVPGLILASSENC